jgi:RND family efflux transporter MFP subunit
VGGAGCSHTSNQATGNRGDAVAVRALQVQAEPVARRVELVGTLEGQQEVTVSSEVAARVVAIHADLGDRVEAGQVLIELDPTEFHLAVERQQAVLGEVLARLGMGKEDAPVPEPAQVSGVRRAAAELAEARSNYERGKTLLAEGVVSQQLYDNVEARYRIAEANYTAAVQEVRNLVARLENLRAELGIAREKLSDTHISAPFAGTVRERLVEVGQYVKEQTPVISLATTNPLKLRAEVPERWFPYVKPGAAVEVTVEAYPGESFPGRVERVARAVNPQSRTVALEAQVANPQERLRPGLFARARLVTSRTDAIVRVPASAVVSFYGVQKVYAIENGEIRERVVKLGDRFGDTVEVTEGLAAGTWIATSELARIRQGIRVEIRKED